MTKNKYLFHNVEYPILNGSIDILNVLLTFINEHKPSQYLSIIVQIRESDNTYFTLGNRYPLDILDRSEVLNYAEYLSNKLAVLDQKKYHPESAISLIINYGDIDKDNYLKLNNILTAPSRTVQVALETNAPLGLPLDTNYLNWSSLTEWLSPSVLRVSELAVDVSKTLNRFIEVTFMDKVNRTIKIIAKSSELSVAVFTDKIINSAYGEFIRIIGDTSYHILNNKVFFIFERLYPKEFITQLRPNKTFNLSLLTLDIETYVDSNKNMSIYCVSLYDGEKALSFYITDYKDIKALLNDLYATLFTRKYTGKTIYIHNSSEFDLIFLLKHLVNYPSLQVNPVIKDGKFINVNIIYGPKQRYSIDLRDSMLLLQSSLSKLGKAFKVEALKDIFPHNFVTPDNLSYIGAVPNYEFFDSSKVSIEDYKEYASRFTKGTWSLKTEAIKYCELDCVSLYQVVYNFAELIFNMFQVNLSKCPTLPSLAFRIYRTHFIPKGVKIPVIEGKVFDNLSNAYYGGHVDMYIPTNPEGSLVYHYDVNSLYPSAMKEFKYPTNIFAYFQGDISKVNDYSKLFNNSLGVFKVKVTCPKGIEHPILPHKVGNATVFGEGTWTGWYYSEELVNALRFGYTFEILEGYLFEGENIFSTYVDRLYKLKEESDRDSPMYLIAKLLMNSLYGRFGMSRALTSHAVVKQSKVDEFIEKIGLENMLTNLDLGDKTIISYSSLFPNTPKINMSIAAAISANSRVMMSQFKNNSSSAPYPLASQ